MAKAEKKYVSRIEFRAYGCHQQSSDPAFIGVDMNEGSKGDWIYPYVYYTDNRSEAITGFAFIQGQHTGAPTHYTKIDMDLNKGAGGAYNYLCVTKIGNVKVTKVSFFSTGGAFTGTTFMKEWKVFPQDLNTGARRVGKYIYLIYQTENMDCSSHSSHKSGVSREIDPRRWQGPSRQMFNKRKMMTLYHVTDDAGAASIKRDWKMLRGKSGMFGGGIYFAETASVAKAKAHHTGWLVTARVCVGKELILYAPDQSLTFTKVQRKGCDSVYAPKGSGSSTGQAERVVYNFDQVCVLTVEKY